MKVNQLYTVNFRNYNRCQLALPAMINVFFGANAQGKTNIIEALFYSAFASSHRTNREDDLLSWGTTEMAVGAEFENFSGRHTVKIKRYHSNNKWVKELFVDSAKVKPKEHYGTLNAVMFSPEDLQIVKGEPALRRKFFDMQIAQTNPLYYDLLTKYNRVVLQRNKQLKEVRDNHAPLATLAPWNGEFIRLATVLTQKRLDALTKWKPLVSRIYGSIAGNGEALQVRYEQKGNNSTLHYPQSAVEISEDFYREKLAEREHIDIVRGTTGIGPHRDDLELLLNEVSLRSFGSQGQQRSGALALKLSQLEYVQQEIGEYPILLLDDVMSELDNNRRAQLLQFIDGRVQTFVTVNDKELIPDLHGTAYFKIEQGTIQEVV